MHPTDFKLLKLNQPAGRCYTAAANLSWVSPWWTPCSVPVIQSAISFLVNSRYREPRPLEITVMVNAQSGPNNQQQKTKSMLKRLSAEEEHVSYISATWRNVSKGEHVQAGGQIYLTQQSVTFQNLLFFVAGKQSVTSLLHIGAIPPRRR